MNKILIILSAVVGINMAHALPGDIPSTENLSPATPTNKPCNVTQDSASIYKDLTENTVSALEIIQLIDKYPEYRSSFSYDKSLIRTYEIIFNCAKLYEKKIRIN